MKEFATVQIVKPVAVTVVIIHAGMKKGTG
jgi:hypothetical protein